MIDESANTGIVKKTVEQHLNSIVYGDDKNYIPSDFALEFINFIKLVNGLEGEENLSPVLHFRMLDMVRGRKQNIANMLFRGSAKTTLLGEYLFLYIGVYGAIPDFGKVGLALYVSDSIENGVKNMRKNLEYRWENSEFLQKYIPKTRFTDVRWEFNNIDGNRLIVKGYGAKALTLDSKLYTNTGFTAIGDCQVGDEIFGADGKLTNITAKSEIFDKPIYEIKLTDNRTIKVSEDHINSIVIKGIGSNEYRDLDVTTKELLEMDLYIGKPLRAKEQIFIRNCKPLRYSEKEFTIDPYTLGVILGASHTNEMGRVDISMLQCDFEEMTSHIPYVVKYIRKHNRSRTLNFKLNELAKKMRLLHLNVLSAYKFIPESYFFGSITQRTAILAGLMDTCGVFRTGNNVAFLHPSRQMRKDIKRLVRSLGGSASGRDTEGTLTRVRVCMPTQIFRLKRLCKLYAYSPVNKTGITSITLLPQEPSQCIAVNNDEHQFITGEFIRTHNTGVRGAKEMGKRPNLALLDDLVSDEDARSATVIASIEDTVYKAVDYALHPKNSKVIWSGTPFNSRDPLYKAVESGAWHVNVYPVCETFPCTREEFNGAWEDRFTYDYVKGKYNKALLAGKVDTFNQELMLRIMSDEDRLILDGDIMWYKRANVMQNKARFNFYITTDFATSEKTSADYSVIAVWAYNSAGDWLWVDGICKRQHMDKNVKDLFRLAQMYKPEQVGIEVSGQQGGFIQWIVDEQVRRNMYFALASDGNSNKPGIRPNTNKMQRFQIMVPVFKTHKMYFPEEMRNDPIIVEYISELSLAAAAGFKSKHDDCIDTISMLGSLQPWKPSEDTPEMQDHGMDIWDDHIEPEDGDLASYIV